MILSQNLWCHILVLGTVFHHWNFCGLKRKVSLKLRAPSNHLRTCSLSLSLLPIIQFDGKLRLLSMDALLSMNGMPIKCSCFSGNETRYLFGNGVIENLLHHPSYTTPPPLFTQIEGSFRVQCTGCVANYYSEKTSPERSPWFVVYETYGRKHHEKTVGESIGDGTVMHLCSDKQQQHSRTGRKKHWTCILIQSHWFHTHKCFVMSNQRARVICQSAYDQYEQIAFHNWKDCLAPCSSIT